MIRIRTQGPVMGSLLAFALAPAFWPGDAAAVEIVGDTL
jgi:hypothetical protein